MDNKKYMPKYFSDAAHSLEDLRKLMLVDGYDMVLDMDKSHASELVDKKSGKTFHDFFSFFAAMPISINHPKLNTQEFIEYIGKASLNKPSNSDI